MSFASGFFNSVDHDRLYDATDISRLFDGLIRDGIFASIGDCFVVKQSNQMNVTVGTGRAWFNHTWSYNDALYPVTIPPSEILMDRIDAIVLEINSVEAVRANSIKLIKGTPSSTPTKPSLTNAKEVHQYPLAYVKVGKEVTSIRQADIENCVGTSVCPFVTGILEVISIEQLIPQWKDILNRFVEENTANFNTWMNGEKQDYQAWLTAAKKEITDWEATSKSDYQKWYDSIKNGYDQWFATIKAAYDANWSTFQQWEKSSQAEFDKWFENMKNKLEGDLGAKLTLETEKLGNEKVSLIESTKKDLLGTVEAPLMIGNAMRNLLKPPLAAHSGYGIKMTKIDDGTLKLNGTARGNYVFYLQGNSSQSVPFENTVGGCKMLGCPINGSQDTYRIDVCYYNSSELNSELKAVASDIGNGVIIDDAYPYLNYRLYINNGTTVTNLTFKPMVTTDLEATIDDFVPYSGYDIKTYGKNILAYPYAQKTANNHGLTFTVLKEGMIKIEGTTEKSFLAFIISTDECNAFLLRMLKAGHDLKISAKKSVTNVEAYIQVFTNTNVYVKNFSDILKHDAYDWSEHHVIIAIQHNNPASNVNATISDIMVTLDDFVPYSGYDIKTYGKNILAYPYAQKTANNHGLTFTVLKEGMIKIEGTTEKSFLAFIISTDECNAFLLRMLKAGHDLKISAKKSVTNVEAYIQVFTNTNVYVKNFSDILKHDAYDWSEHHVIIAIQHNNPASNVNATISDIMVTLDDSDTTVFTPYQSSTTKITKDTEFPNFDLKTFDGATHIISPGNVQSFHADAPNGKYLLESIKKSAESGGVSYGVNAPANPKAGDLWIDPSSGSLIQYWTGSKWTPTRALDTYGSDVVKSDSKPNAKRSTLWIDSGNGNAMKHVAEDGTVTELSSGGTSYGASAPSNTKLLWIDNSGVARFYNGSAWVPLAATWG